MECGSLLPLSPRHGLPWLPSCLFRVRSARGCVLGLGRRSRLRWEKRQQAARTPSYVRRQWAWRRTARGLFWRRSYQTVRRESSESWTVEG